MPSSKQLGIAYPTNSALEYGFSNRVCVYADLIWYINTFNKTGDRHMEINDNYQNNGKSSGSTNQISEVKILQGSENQLQNQERIMNSWLSGHELKNGRYIIQRKLTWGGFADIYLAKDQEENQDVAIKILKSELPIEGDSDSFEENFIKEAMNLKSCQHPHIVRFKNIIKTSEGWCMVMEYIEGEDLKIWVGKNGPLSERDALRYIHQIGMALIEVHNQQLLHRDVKPRNIIRRTDGLEAILIDFGIARKFSPDKTEKHTPYLTEDFAPIEQHMKKYKRGAYTDVYALAATLYFLLTSKNPISSMERQDEDTLEPPQQLNKNISLQVDNAIIEGMKLLPNDRPQSIQDWLNLLPINEGKIANQPTGYDNKNQHDIDTELVAGDTTRPSSPLPIEHQPSAPVNNNQRDMNTNSLELLGRSAFMSVAIWLLVTSVLKLIVNSDIRYLFSLLLCVGFIFLSQYRLSASKSKSYLFISAGISTLLIFLAIVLHIIPAVGLENLTLLPITYGLLTIGAGAIAFTVMAALKFFIEPDNAS